MIFPRYQNYRLSAVDWLGEVPADWEITRMKYVASLKGRLGWQNLRADEYTEEGPLLVTSEHLSNDRVDWDSCYHVSEDRYAMAPEIQLRAGDLLMMKDGAAMGKLGYIDQLPGPACLNSHLLLFRPRDNRVTNRFLYYVLGSPSFTTYMLQERTGSTFFGISQEDIGAFRLVLPPQESLHAIVSFLDCESAKIDGLVAEQQRLIELLKEKRQAVIRHATTRGLNPDAPLRQSGLEWLGDVPAHWQVASLKRLVEKIESGTSVNAVDEPAEEGHAGVLKTSCVYTGEFDADQNKTVVCEEVDRVSCALRSGTLIVSRMNTPELIGAAGFVQSARPNLFLPDRLWQVSIRDAEPRFIHYWTLSRWYRGQVEAVCTGTSPSMKNLAQDDFLSFVLAVPPIDEQRSIVSFLGVTMAAIDALVGEAERAIALLQERRTALISAAVTGKIDVRGLADAEAVAA